MWSYIARRLLLMIPTLFGVTIVSFCIMQLAPGDPMLNQLSAGGAAGQSGQTRDAYLLQKRDLKLDKPLVLNFRYFTDFSQTMRLAAHYRSLDIEALVADLTSIAEQPELPVHAERLRFLRSLKIDQFEDRLTDPEKRRTLAYAVTGYVQSLCEDLGERAVPATIGILEAHSDSKEPETLRLKLGAVRCLRLMVLDPFVYTYSRTPSDEETPNIVATWRLWWDRAKATAEPLDTETVTELNSILAEMAGAKDSNELYALMENLDRAHAGFFAEKLIGQSTLQEKVVSALFLRLMIGSLDLDLPLDATPAQIEAVSQNWLAYYAQHSDEYQPSLKTKLVNVFVDTQYAYMLQRLVTFDFGLSSSKTREPVSEKLWRAFVVSAPLMAMAQLVIYLVAVPLGIMCAVYRGRTVDRTISLGLFVLYSVPGFVAGMIFLVLFCYGDFLKLFPMSGLHSEGYENMSTGEYIVDYLWHVILPVTCLSLFSLASVAMYSRSSMLDVISQDYIRTARAKGLPRRKVILKHALRNALIPILTIFSNTLPALLGGSVLVEKIFSVPGMGFLSFASIEQKDFPTLMALIYVEAIVVLVSFLVTDLLYVLVDPRISFAGRGQQA